MEKLYQLTVFSIRRAEQRSAGKIEGRAPQMSRQYQKQGGGIEKIFIVNSPWVKEVKVLSRAKVRRAKLYYLRERTGKSARLKRKF